MKGVKMTKKDFSLIASVLKTHQENISSDDFFELASDFMVALSLDNPRFDQVKFLSACGLDPQ